MHSIDFIVNEAVRTLPASMEFLKHLVSDFPGRQCGTDMGAEAGNFIWDSFRELGLEMAGDSFHVPGYIQKEGYISAYTEDEEGRRNELFRCDSLTAIYSPAGVTSGPLLAHEKDSPLQGNLQGQVILSEESLRKYRDDIDNAAAWIYITPERTRGGRFISSMTDYNARFYIGRVPACSISWEDGRKLLAIGKSVGSSLHVEVKTDAGDIGVPREGRSILADIVPRDGNGYIRAEQGQGSPPGEIIIAGSHYDSFLNVPGATDNGAGMAVLFGAASILANMSEHFPLRRRIRCIAFDGEELGLLGSSAYVKAHSNELARYRCMVNLDCTGKVGSKALKVHGWDSLLDDMKAIADSIPLIGGRIHNWYSYRSDHQPFWREGIPTIYGFGGTHPLAYGQHTEHDGFENVIPDGILTDTIITASLLWVLASSETLPWINKQPREMEQILDGYGIYKEIQRFQADQEEL